MPTVLLADADVLIDYRDSELAVLKLVGQHVGRIAVLPSVLGEVRGVSRADCARLAIAVVEVDTQRLLTAGGLDTSVSFNDRLCFLVCREKDWTCVTNDGALRRLCERHAVRAVASRHRWRMHAQTRDILHLGHLCGLRAG